MRVIQDIEIPYKSSGDLVPGSGNSKLGNFANFEKFFKWAKYLCFRTQLGS